MHFISQDFIAAMELSLKVVLVRVGFCTSFFLAHNFVKNFGVLVGCIRITNPFFKLCAGMVVSIEPLLARYMALDSS